jgi:hypothetical protein
MLPNHRAPFPPYYYAPPIHSPCTAYSILDSPFLMQNYYPYIYGNVPGPTPVFGIPVQREEQARP